MQVGKLYHVVDTRSKTATIILAIAIPTIPASGRLTFPRDVSNFRAFCLGEIFMHVCTAIVGGNQSNPVDELHSIFLFESKLWAWDQSIDDQENCFEMVSK